MLNLKTLTIVEYRDNSLDVEISKLNLKEFNLLISDNAQGKTRLFNTIKYMKSLVSGSPRNIFTTFNGVFSFIDSNSNNNIEYILGIFPSEGKNNYEEIIKVDGNEILNSKKKILINEKSGKKVESIFIPKNIPAIAAISEEEFITINQINSFFSKIVSISSNRSREIDLNPDAVIPNEFGSNMSSVLYNWYNSHPELYNEVIGEFKNNFDFIEEVIFTEEKIGGISTRLLSLKEKGIDRNIRLIDWSDGLIRTLHLLMLAKVQYESNSSNSIPSLILIDEIENGLDFKTLRNIVNYFFDHRDDSQIIITSHSPLVCELIHPKYWQIVKRKGPVINYLSPADLENDLTDALNDFKQKHWDFYSKHINNSTLYVVK